MQNDYLPMGVSQGDIDRELEGSEREEDGLLIPPPDLTGLCETCGDETPVALMVDGVCQACVREQGEEAGRASEI